MLKKIAFVMLASGILSGCATVPMADKEVSAKAKTFEAPPTGKAGLYIYRNSTLGGALKKDVRVNGKCIGETAPNMFFYEVVNGNEEQNISTESEFSPNDLKFKAEAGKNYFIRQYIKLGVFVGGAGLEQVSDSEGKADISGLNMAVQENVAAKQSPLGLLFVIEAVKGPPTMVGFLYQSIALPDDFAR